MDTRDIHGWRYNATGIKVGIEFDASSVALTDRGFVIAYDDGPNVGSHDLTITLAATASEFTLTRSEILDVLEII